MVQTSSPVFYFDFSVSPQLTCSYFSYDITNNSGADYSDLWITAGSFGSGCVGLAPNETGRYHVGPLSAGQTKPAFFYLKASCGTTTPQPYLLTAYPSIPPAKAVATQAFTFTSAESTNQTNSNQVTIVFSGPNPPAVGGIETMTVTGTTGTIGSDHIMAFSPASYSGWNAAYFQLVSTSITVASPNAATHLNKLLLPTYISSTAASDYVAVYNFRVGGSTPQSTTVSPIAYISSGTPVKHTDTGNYSGANFAPVSGAVNSLTLSESSSPASATIPGPINYTLRLDNAGPLDAAVDSFRQTFVNSPGLPTVLAGSTTFNGLPAADPVLQGSTLIWGGSFAVPSVSFRELKFKVLFPCAMGTYTDQSTAFAGPTQIDTTLDTTDDSPAGSSAALGGCTYTYTSTPTWTPTATPSSTPTASPSPTKTATLPGTLTDSPTPSQSATWTGTATPTATATATPTATQTATPSGTPSSTPSHSPTSTSTDSPTATSTDSPTSTSTGSPTSTPTDSPTPSSTDSPTPSSTDSPTSTSTDSPTSTPTDSPSATPTDSPTDSPTPTHTATDSPTPTATDTATSSDTPTDSPTATPSATQSATATDSPTPTYSSTETATRTASETATETATPSDTPTATPTASETGTDLPTVTDSPTATPSPTFSSSPTATATPTTVDVTLLGSLGGHAQSQPEKLLKLHPNPVRDGGLVSLDFGPSGADADWSIYNLAGERVASFSVSGRDRQSWSSAGVAPGLYFVAVEARYPGGTKERLRLKLVVLR